MMESTSAPSSLAFRDMRTVSRVLTQPVPAIYSINCYADDLGLLVLIEDVTLAVGAQNKNTVNSGINQPFDLINKFFTVNCSVLTHWC